MRNFHTIYGAPGHPFKVDRTEWSEGPLRFRDRPPSTTSSTPPSTTSSVPRGVVDEALQKLQLAQRRIEELEKELQVTT